MIQVLIKDEHFDQNNINENIKLQKDILKLKNEISQIKLNNKLIIINERKNFIKIMNKQNNQIKINNKHIRNCEKYNLMKIINSKLNIKRNNFVKIRNENKKLKKDLMDLKLNIKFILKSRNKTNFNNYKMLENKFDDKFNLIQIDLNKTIELQKNNVKVLKSHEIFIKANIKFINEQKIFFQESII